MRTLTLVLGAVLTVYCSAGILSETVWPNNIEVNRLLCKFLLCSDAPPAGGGRQNLVEAVGADAEKAATVSRSVLQRDPQNAYRWAELGEAYLDAGQRENARYCYRQVLALAPNSPPLLLRAANFHLVIGENQEALPITARILALIPDYDSIIFNDYARLVDHPEDVLQYGLPEDRRAVKSWLQFLMQAGRLDDAQRSWRWAAGLGYADDALAGEYTDFLVRQGHPDVAASAWGHYWGARAGEYSTSTYLFNGGFESEPVPSPFDWSMARAEGVEVARDCTTAFSGECSLCISFTGTRNLALAFASQQTFVTPGSYRFHATIRTDSLTTDQGIRFRVLDSETPGRLDVTFGHFTGTNPWSEVEYGLVVPRATRLLQVQVMREASLKFDNKIDGTAWIDDVSLKPAPLHSP
jgi:tetratricopeptide (TPR) repeat protein